MYIKRRIKLGNNNYYIKLDCIYKLKQMNYNLVLNNYKDDYFDNGDISQLIKLLEDKYNVDDVCNKYGKDILFLSNCLYIYDNIPFISGIGDYILAPDNNISEISYISKEELDDYIKSNNINMKINENFKLYDSRTWNIF